MSGNRDYNRLPVQWPVVLVIDGHASGIHGRTIDLGMGGAGVIIDTQLPAKGALTLYLGLPPTAPGHNFVAVEIRCRIAHAEYSSEYECFRAGLEFRGFAGKGEALLENALILRNGEPKRRRANGDESPLLAA